MSPLVIVGLVFAVMLTYVVASIFMAAFYAASTSDGLEKSAKAGFLIAGMVYLFVLSCVFIGAVLTGRIQ